MRSARFTRRRLALAAVLSVAPALTPATARASGEAATDFTLRDLNGKPVSLSDFKGKVVVLDFWATWCQPCLAELPHLEQMYKDLSDKGLVVLGISADDARSASMVKAVARRDGYTFPVLHDKDTSVVSRYDPSKILPYTVIVDRDQKIVRIHQGYTPGDEVELRKTVEELLGLAPTPAAGEDAR